MIYWELFRTFFTIGLFTFGGGHAMIPMIQSEVVSRGWASIETVIDFIAVSESTPGPFAVNMATFIGNKIAGPTGALCSTFGVILPSFIIIMVIAKFFANFRENKWVKRAFTGLKAAVIGLISYAAFTIIKSGLHINVENGFVMDIKAAVVFVCALGLTFLYKKLHPIAMIAISALLGIVLWGFL